MPTYLYTKMKEGCIVGSYCQLPKQGNPFDEDPESTYILIPARMNPNYRIPETAKTLVEALDSLIKLRLKYENRINKLNKKILKYDKRIDDLYQDLPPDQIDIFLPDEYID